MPVVLNHCGLFYYSFVKCLVFREKVFIFVQTQNKKMIMKINENYTTHKQDIRAIDSKLRDIDAALIKARNIVIFATVCENKTNSEHYRGVYAHNKSVAQAEVTQLKKEKIIFEKGFNEIIKKY